MQDGRIEKKKIQIFLCEDLVKTEVEFSQIYPTDRTIENAMSAQKSHPLTLQSQVQGHEVRRDGAISLPYLTFRIPFSRFIAPALHRPFPPTMTKAVQFQLPQAQLRPIKSEPRHSDNNLVPRGILKAPHRIQGNDQANQLEGMYSLPSFYNNP